MQILRYWKRVDLPRLSGVTYDIVLTVEVRQNEAFFDNIVEVVRKAEFLDYVIVEQDEMLMEHRGVDPSET